MNRHYFNFSSRKSFTNLLEQLVMNVFSKHFKDEIAVDS